jgi:MFS family permease
MTSRERTAILSLAGAYSLRMLGLYLALPILSPYAADLPGGTSFWVGMAVGVYGIGQAIFQMPFGILSDHFGRRPAILLGLGVFGLGSLLAAVATTAPMLVAGRFLQGMGAISSVVVATVADLTREEVRQRAMSMLGINIGVAFGCGLVGGPLLATHLGVPGLFYLSGGLAVVALVTTFFLVPEPVVSSHVARPTFRQTIGVFRDPVLLRINVAMMALHLGLTAMFVVLPLQMGRFVDQSQLWKTYAPVIGVGLAGMLVTAEFVDRYRVNKEALLAGALCLVGGGLLMWAGFDSKAGLFWGLILFVLGFSVVEPVLPVLVTQYTSASVRGTAAASFNMSQFTGAGLGGLAGAYFLARVPANLFLLIGILATVIFLMSLTLPNPRSFRQFEVRTRELTPGDWHQIQQELLLRRGVRDAVYHAGDEPTIRVKYAPGTISEEELRAVVPDRS